MLSLDLDLADATLLLAGRRHGDLEHAIAEARRGILRVDPLREGMVRMKLPWDRSLRQ